MLFKQLTIIFIIILSIVCGQSCSSGNSPGGNTDTLYKIAMAEFEQGKYKEAIAIFNKVLEIEPGNIDGYRYRGRSKGIIGDLTGAIADCSKGLEIAPRDADLYLSRGISYVTDRFFELALDDFAKVIEIDPGNMLPYSFRADVHIRTGDYQAALKDLNYIIAGNIPGVSRIYAQRGEVFALMGDFTKAFDDFDRALGSNPKNASVYACKTHAYIYLKQYENAIIAAKKMLKYSERYLTAFSRTQLGHSYFLAGQYENAHTEYNKAMTISQIESDALTWHYLALCKIGKNDVNLLKTKARKVINPWMKTIVDFFCGRLTPEQLLKAASHKSPVAQRERLTEANFFIGEHYLLKGEKEKAADFFKKCIEYNCPLHIENMAAKMELDRLQAVQK